MKFATVDNNRIEATRGAIGFCPAFGSETVAKCGLERVDHWVHKGTRHCDPWWEPETEWHRLWKVHFS